MEQGNVIQVFRYRTLSDGERRLMDVWEMSAARAVRTIADSITSAYTDGKDDTYEVMTIVDGVGKGARKLCWDTPPRCRKERLCVVLLEHNTLEDFREYCTDFLS